MVMCANGGSALNYEPNSASGPAEDKSKETVSFPFVGAAGRYPNQHPNDHYEQPRALFRKVLKDDERMRLIENIVGSLG